MICPAAPDESPILEDDTDEENAIYQVHYIKQLPGGKLLPGRNICFDRIDLSIVRQMVFAPDGSIVSDTRYSQMDELRWWLMFPAQIDINRPKDGYGVVIAIVDMQMNKELTNAQFELAQARRLPAQTDRSFGRFRLHGHSPGHYKDDLQARGR